MRPFAQFVLAVAACLLLSTTAHAQTIDGCVMNNGILKVLDEGAECLPQETLISLGQSQPVETVRVFDGEGRDLGAFVDARYRTIISIPVPALPLGVLLSGVGAILLVDPDKGLPAVAGGIAFSDSDCLGRGFMNSNMSNILIPDPRSEGSWFIGSKTEIAFSLIRSSLRPDGSCFNSTSPEPAIWPLVPVEEFKQDLGVTFPLPLPLWIGSSSSDSP
jgi:hypothetical protein